MFARTVRSRSSMITNHLQRPVSSLHPHAMGTGKVPTQAERNNSSAITSVHTDQAYSPFAHYVNIPLRDPSLSQAIKSAPGNSHIYLSGQIPADASGTLIKGSVADKTTAIINNTEAILKEAGAGLEGVVKVVVFLKDARIMPEFAKVYDAAFPHRPARSMVEVSALPAGVDIQVDFIAVC